MVKTVPSRRVPTWAALIPFVVVLCVTSWVMRVHGFGFWAQGRLVGVELVTILLPGFVLSIWAARMTWVARLSAAFVCGLPVQLLGWLLAVTLGAPALAWVVPILVFVSGAVWGRERLTQELTTPRVQMGAWPAVWLAAMWLVVLGRFASSWTRNPPGENAVTWYQDLYWHLAINASAMHQVPTVDPQAYFEVFDYHWLTNAHIGALALTGNIDLLSLTAVAWMVPVFAATIGLAYGFAYYLAHSLWAGTLAAGLVIFPPMFALDRTMDSGTAANFVLGSPSHIFGLPVSVGLVWLIVILLREGTKRWTVVAPATVALLLISPGVKVSSLAVVLCGLLLALASAVVTRRRAMLIGAITIVVAAVTLLSFPIFGGGGGGSKLELFGGVNLRPVFRAGLESMADYSGPVQFGFLVAFAFLITLNYLWTLPALGAFRPRDPVAWFLLGFIGSAIAVTFVLKHPSDSQLYFARGIQPILAAVAAVGLQRIIARSADAINPLAALRDLVPWTLAALGTGALVFSAPRLTSITASNLAWQLLVVLVMVGSAAILLKLLGKTRAVAVLSVVVMAFSVGDPLTAATDAQLYSGFSKAAVAAQQAAQPTAGRDITPVEMDALEMMRSELPADAVVATNVHCIELETTRNCDARAFWVAGLGERQVLLGGWAYTSDTRALNGVDGRHHYFQTYPNEALFKLNEAVFYAPSSDVLARVSAMGVTHLFATSRAGVVSDELTSFCEPLFQEDGVLLCRLPGQ